MQPEALSMPSASVLPRHLLLWREPPLWPFVWRGLLPLLVLAGMTLIAVGPFAHGAIQASVQREVRDQLNSAGFDWVTLVVSGQSITLSGEQPAPGAGERAIARARASDCPTWLGRYRCAVSVVGRFSAPAPFAGALPAQAAAEACERSLSRALGGEQIGFASGSAIIEARSGPLLDRLAREARNCSGSIGIEGHTDIIGRTAFNHSLSEARAGAVRDALIARGVPAERLRAAGFGASRPIADNGSEEGRARNRRIEFHAVSAE
jgi:outer membrane protein OmpA-like peptidoglycan-associated protein